MDSNWFKLLILRSPCRNGGDESESLAANFFISSVNELVFRGVLGPFVLGRVRVEAASLLAPPILLGFPNYPSIVMPLFGSSGPGPID